MQAELRFLAGEGQADFTGGFTPPRDSVRFVGVPTEVRDGRREAPTSLDREGFALIASPHAVADFYDPEQVRTHYYPAAAEIIKAQTGADAVVVLSHLVRTTEREQNHAELISVPGKFMHNDYTAESAAMRLREALPDAAARGAWRRTALLHLWRPIRGPLETNPLVVGDGTSFAPEDLVRGQHDLNGTEVDYLVIRHNPAQRWFYFPRMQPEEAILFKCFDSDPALTAFSGHGAMDDPATPADALPRESIELRAFALFA